MKLSDLKGFGPKSCRILAKIGITTREQLMNSDPYALYARLKQVVPGVSLNMLYAIIGAQEGLHWQDVARSRKTEILMRLDDMGLAPKR